MHNRVHAGVEPRDIRFADGLVLVPLVAVILALALYPQVLLEKGERTIPAKVEDASLIAHPETQVIR
jgi:NADH:ubiquinone oxidoreductase subunit 4 (subunit M)